MMQFYTENELKEIGFKTVGRDVMVSKSAQFFAIEDGFLGNRVRIDTYSILTGRIVLEDDVHISPFCFLGGTGGVITMKKKSGVASHVSIYTKSADYTQNKIDESLKITGDVFIDENSIIGSGSRLMPGIKISHSVSVGCNCVVNRNIAYGEILVNRSMNLISLSKRV